MIPTAAAAAAASGGDGGKRGHGDDSSAAQPQRSSQVATVEREVMAMIPQQPQPQQRQVATVTRGRAMVALQQ